MLQTLALFHLFFCEQMTAKSEALLHASFATDPLIGAATTLDAKSSDNSQLASRDFPDTWRAGIIQGGYLVSQASAAAARTVPVTHHLNSCHLYFGAPGEESKHIDYEVERVREGKNFCTRRATGRQNGVMVVSLMASFESRRREPGAQPRVCATVSQSTVSRRRR